MNEKKFLPNRIYVHKDAASDTLTKRVISRSPNAEIISLDDHGDPLTELQENNSMPIEQLFSRGKRELLLTRYRGAWMRACPGTQAHVCCNLWTVNPGEGCPLDCTYCYLQSYLKRNPTLKLYTNTADMFSEIENKLTAEPARLFRVGTGEVIDSLVWDQLTDSSVELVDFFARFSNAALELKTKSNFVDNLVELKNRHNNNTVVSWSVNAEQIIDKDEESTASLTERINAAARVIEAGYRVGFHFDPVIHFKGWQDGYRDAIEKIFSEINPDNIAWVSVSTLRYPKPMQQTMLKRFPESEIPFGDQILAKDNKLRYIQPLRLKLISFIWKELKKRSDKLPTYMCMESSTAWKNIAGGPPAAGEELVEIFSRQNSKRIHNIA